MSPDKLREIDILRSLESICDAWENDNELSVEDMTTHVEEVIKVADGKNDFNQFLKNTRLKNIQHS